MRLPSPLRDHLHSWLQHGDADALDAAAAAADAQPIAAALDGDAEGRLSRVLDQLRAAPVLDRLSDPGWEPTDGDWDAIADALSESAEALPARHLPRPRRRWRPGVVLSGLLLAAAAVLLLVRLQPEPALALVTPEEAAQISQRPPLRGAPAQSRGPTITQVAPSQEPQDEVFDLALQFTPAADGVALDPGSLQVTYLRGAGIDVTERLRAHFDGARLQARITLPPGLHAFEVFISDIEQRGTRIGLEITVE